MLFEGEVELVPGEVLPVRPLVFVNHTIPVGVLINFRQLYVKSMWFLCYIIQSSFSLKDFLVLHWVLQHVILEFL
jgi:hypothetical protein